VAFEASRVCGPSGSSVSSCSVRTPRSAAQTDSADSLVGISATGLREHRTPRYRIALGSCHPGTPASCSVAVVICTGARASSNPTVPLGVDARSLRIAWAADAELKAETGQSLSSARKEALKFAELYLESMTYSHLLHRRAFSFLVVSRSRSQLFISVPPVPFFPCFVVLARFDSRSFWNGFLRVVSNSPSFQVAFSTMILRSRRRSAGGCAGNALQRVLVLLCDECEG